MAHVSLAIKSMHENLHMHLQIPCNFEPNAAAITAIIVISIYFYFYFYFLFLFLFYLFLFIFIFIFIFIFNTVYSAEVKCPCYTLLFNETLTKCYLILLLHSPIGLVGGSGGVGVCCWQQTISGRFGGGVGVVGEGGQQGMLLMVNKLVSVQQY